MAPSAAKEQPVLVQRVDLTFTANQNWFLAFNVAQWAGVYDLTQGSYTMHARAAPGAALLYGWSSSTTDGLRGTVAYDPATKLLYVLAPYADMRALVRTGDAWTGVYDLQYTPGLEVAPGIPVVQDLVAGSLAITDGVTLT